MTSVLGALMQKWAIPWMAARRIMSCAHQGNVGSVRVFEKNGFVVYKTAENFFERVESKGGGMVGLHFVDWQYDAKAT